MASYTYVNPSVSHNYSSVRPTYNAEWIEIIQSFLQDGANSPSFDLAVDVACGTGQATRALAPLFGKTIGADISTTQLEEARASSPGNIQYIASSAEEIEKFVSPHSVDLITVAQALHWFEVDVFLPEIIPLLKKPNGAFVTSIFGPKLNFVDRPELTEIVGKFIDSIFQSIYHEAKWVPLYMSRYGAVPFNDYFEVVEKKNFTIKRTLSKTAVQAWMQSCACVQTFKRVFPNREDPTTALNHELENILPPESEIYWDGLLILCKTPKVVARA